MPLLRFKQKIINLVPVLAIHGSLQREKVRADVRQTVQLVEERDIVDLAVGSGFAQGELVKALGGGVGEEDEAVAWWEEGGPGFVS